MKFEVDVPDDKIPALRSIVSEMMDEDAENVTETDLITELFYIYTGYHGSELDLRNVVTVKVL